MAAYYHQFVEKLDQALHEKNKVTDVLVKIETATGIKRTYIAQGFLGVLSLYMIVGYFAEFVCNSVAFGYPAYASIHALESRNKDDDTKWLTYWVVFAFFSVIEFFSDIIFSWFPFYWLFKIIFLVWCMMPMSNNGSVFVYNRFVRPVFLKNQQKLDTAVNSAVGTMSDLTGKVLDGARKLE